MTSGATPSMNSQSEPEMSDDYDVGYRKPPKSGQFQPGQSGNPNGRPKKSKDIQAAIRAMLDSQVDVTVDGKLKKMTVTEAMIMRIRNDILTGKPTDRNRAIKQLRELCPDMDLSEVEEDYPHKVIVEIVKPNIYGGVFDPTDEEKTLIEQIIRARREGRLNECDMFLTDEDDWRN